MSKEQEAEQVLKESEETHQLYQRAVQKAVRSACRKKGGLMMRLRWRGHRQVNEIITFGHQTKVDVIVNPRNYDVTLVLDGKRYQTELTHGGSALIRQALAGGINFEENLSFRTAGEEQANALS